MVTLVTLPASTAKPLSVGRRCLIGVSFKMVTGAGVGNGVRYLSGFGHPQKSGWVLPVYTEVVIFLRVQSLPPS